MTPAAKEQRGPIAVLRVLGVGFALQVAASIAMLSVGTVVLNVTTGQESSDILAHPWPTLTIALFAQGLFGYIFYRLARRLSERRLGFSPVELSVRQPNMPKELGGGLAIGFAFISAVVGVLALLGYYQPTGLHWTPGIVYGLALGVGAAFVEEPAFRGIMLGGLTRLMSPGWAIALSSLVFGLAHLVSAGGAGRDEWLGVIGIILASSLIFAGAYYLTGRLWLGIGIHLAWNFALGGIYGLTVSGVPSMDGLVRHAAVSGPAILTGGAFGPEGSIILVVLGLALGAGLMWRARQVKGW